MKNLLVLLLVLFTFLLPQGAVADDISDLKESVEAVREKLVVLLVATDKEKQAAQVKNIKQLSQEIDTKLDVLLKSEKTSEKVKKKLVEFQEIWAAFRTTRDTQIIPNILSGDEEKIKEAKIVARTTQAERFQRMQALLQ